MSGFAIAVMALAHTRQRTSRILRPVDLRKKPMNSRTSKRDSKGIVIH
jgi:hypothetical protein